MKEDSKSVGHRFKQHKITMFTRSTLLFTEKSWIQSWKAPSLTGWLENPESALPLTLAQHAGARGGGEIWVKMTDFEQFLRSRFDPYNGKISWSQLVFDELNRLQTLLGVSKHCNSLISEQEVALKAPFWGVPGYPSRNTWILTDFSAFKNSRFRPSKVKIRWS